MRYLMQQFDRSITVSEWLHGSSARYDHCQTYHQTILL